MAEDDSPAQVRRESQQLKFHSLLERAQRIGMTADIYMLGLLIGYEMGDIQRSLFYSRQRPDGDIYLKTELETAISDLVMQLRVFIYCAGKDWNEMVEMGFERWEARIEDFEKSRGGLRPLR